MQKVFGPYTIEAEIGRGGMGVVYRARHAGLNRLVALKVMEPVSQDSSSMNARFQREIHGGARLEHPHLVRVFEGGMEAGTPFLAMELVDGQSLAELLGRHPVLPWPLATAILSCVLDGLSYLHSLDMLHRDIKPGNILIGRDARVKVTDYGLLTWKDATVLTAAGAVMGSMAYLAPELLRGEGASRSSDLWSAGVTFYRCLTGVLPVNWQPSHLLSGAAALAIVSPRTKDERIPEDVSIFVMRCLTAAPGERLQDATVAKTELDTLLLRHAGRTVAGILTTENIEHPERIGQALVARAARRTALHAPGTPVPGRRVPVLPLLLVLVLLVAVSILFRGAPPAVLQQPATESGRPLLGMAPATLAAAWSHLAPIIAEGDLDGDGMPDLVLGAAVGSPGVIRVYSGRTGELIRTMPVRPEYFGGLSVALVEFNGDGIPDVVVSPGAGWDSRPRILNGKDGQLLGMIHAYSPKWTGGASVAVGRGPPERPWQIITGPGTGGGPHVTVSVPTATVPFFGFFAFGTTARRGAQVVTADVNSDGIDDLIVTPQDRSPPAQEGRVFDGRDFSWLYSFPLYPPSRFEGWRACFRRRHLLQDRQRAGAAVRLLKRECTLNVGEAPERWRQWGLVGAWLTGTAGAPPVRDPRDRMSSIYLDTCLMSLESLQAPSLLNLDRALDLIFVGGGDARGWFLLGLELEAEGSVNLAKLAYERGLANLPEKCYEIAPRVFWQGMVRFAILNPRAEVRSHWLRWADQGADLTVLAHYLKDLPNFREFAIKLRGARH